MAEKKDKQAEADEPEVETPETQSKAAEPKAAEPKAEETEPKAEEPKADESKPKRRGAAETTTRKQAKVVAPTNDEGIVEVRASARFVRSAPRKARLVMDHIRGKSVGDARAILAHTPRAAATDIGKLLESAIANAENNFELDPDELLIQRATVDEGPTIKRFQPRAQGRATPILKRTSHMAITLTTTGDGAGRADTRKARKK